MNTYYYYHPEGGTSNLSFFCSFFSLTKLYWPDIRWAQHPKAGQNSQQLLNAFCVGFNKRKDHFTQKIFVLISSNCSSKQDFNSQNWILNGCCAVLTTKWSTYYGNWAHFKTKYSTLQIYLAITVCEQIKLCRGKASCN